MIITITGKPCSGKGTVSKLFCEKYDFKYICTGENQKMTVFTFLALKYMCFLIVSSLHSTPIYLEPIDQKLFWMLRKQTADDLKELNLLLHR